MYQSIVKGKYASNQKLFFAENFRKSLKNTKYINSLIVINNIYSGSWVNIYCLLSRILSNH